MSSSETDPEDGPRSDAAPIQAILNAADVLTYVSKTNHGSGVREMARALRLTRGTAARVLHSLYVCELLRRDDDTGRYHLGGKFLELAAEHRRRLSLNEVARRHMTSLCDHLRETVYLAVLDSANIVIVDRVDGPQALRMTAELGILQPAFSTSLGKMMLAMMPDAELERMLNVNPILPRPHKPPKTPAELLSDLQLARSRGWALDDCEEVEGVRCIAAPIRDQDRRVIAAISLSGPSFRFPDAKLDTMSRHVVAAATAISRDLGCAPEAMRAAQGDD